MLDLDYWKLRTPGKAYQREYNENLNSEILSRDREWERVTEKWESLYEGYRRKGDQLEIERKLLGCKESPKPVTIILL